MKKLLILGAAALFSNLSAALDCAPVEWGGSGVNYTVGTTTSGTWYVWNCILPNGAYKPEGVVIVAGHKPVPMCMVSLTQQFIDYTATVKTCHAVSAEEKTKYARLLKTLETQKGNLPKSGSGVLK